MKGSKIYIASSWKNKDAVISLAKYLRFDNNEVDCFCETRLGRYVFHWCEIGDLSEIDAMSFLEDKRSQKAFAEDKKWLDWADIIVLLLPCGNSSHLEAGYAKGKGKKLYILGLFPKGEFDVMYGFADKLIHLDNISELKELLTQ
ncbi:hypothetical protein LCGC14_1644290 [marine sediment metagenome]|uniref:Nucleoside 2-deoxyribosyltransferase n=1 Tax=marine sediment metagenome TaxID=412755 RepID=A0A0F9ILA7_9ZZZZ